MVRAFQRNRQAIGENTNPQSLYKHYNKKVKILKKGVRIMLYVHYTRRIYEII